MGESRQLAALCVSCALAVTVALSVVRPASAADAAATWKLLQLDRDRCWDAATMDRDFNGYAEDVRYDIDNDCRWDTRMWNSKGADTFLESLTFDMDENGHWEYWLIDTDQREGFDIAFFDDDEDGFYDRWAWIPKAPDTSLGTIGGAPQRSGAMELVDWLAEKTGRAVWGGPDYDSDGYPDLIDRYPTDRRFR